MLAIGVDLIEVGRLKRSIDRFGQRFLSRVYTDRELAYCDGKAESLAARFAVKEAVGKALGTGIGEVNWREIELLNEKNGRPILVLHGAAESIALAKGLNSWAVSLSHTETHAIGFVVATHEATVK